MDDPIAMPLYSGLLGYVIVIGGSLLSWQRGSVIACGVLGGLLTVGSIAAFSYMAFQLHVAMSGDPSRFPFLSFGAVGAVLLAPVGLVPYLKLKKIRGSSVR